MKTTELKPCECGSTELNVFTNIWIGCGVACKKCQFVIWGFETQEDAIKE
jgi:hypothetical protein